MTISNNTAASLACLVATVHHLQKCCRRKFCEELAVGKHKVLVLSAKACRRTTYFLGAAGATAGRGGRPAGDGLALVSSSSASLESSSESLGGSRPAVAGCRTMQSFLQQLVMQHSTGRKGQLAWIQSSQLHLCCLFFHRDGFVFAILVTVTRWQHTSIGILTCSSRNSCHFRLSDVLANS